MPSADQVPIKLPHLTMLRPKWVVLIAGSTGSALRAVRPPNLHITPVVRRDLVYRASATGALYRSPLAIMAQAIRAILLASAMAATLAGFRASNAVSHGRCPVPWILAYRMTASAPTTNRLHKYRSPCLLMLPSR